MALKNSAVLLEHDEVLAQSGTTVTNVQDVPDAMLTKEALAPHYCPGGFMKYRIIVRNTGTSVLTLANITDDLGGQGTSLHYADLYRAYIRTEAGVETPVALRSIAEVGGQLVVQFVNPTRLIVKECFVLEYVVCVTEECVEDITNEARTVIPNVGQRRASATITPCCRDHFAIFKSAPMSARLGSMMNYELLLHNPTNEQITGAAIMDKLPRGFQLAPGNPISYRVGNNGTWKEAPNGSWTLDGATNTLRFPKAGTVVLTIPPQDWTSIRITGIVVDYE